MFGFRALSIILLMLIFLTNQLKAQIDSTSKYRIASIEISGNDKTKTNIIERELLFHTGDSLNASELSENIQKSQQNLLNTPLFNAVEITFEVIPEATIKMFVRVKERWYLWPEASLYYVDRNFSNWLKEKDFSRIDLGIGMVKYNFRGRNEKLSIYAFVGYDQELLFKYDNIFIDKHRNHALSATIDYDRRKETPYAVIDDRLRQILLDQFVFKAFRSSLTYSYRRDHNEFHSVELYYEDRHVGDTILLLNPTYMTNGKNYTRYLRLKYRFLIDKRDSRVFPESGYKLDVNLYKCGLFNFNASGINSFDFFSEISYYQKLSPRFFLNNDMVLKKSLGKDIPFFLNTGLGYLYNIRGYEYNVVNGTDMVISRNSLNFKLMNKKYYKFERIPYEKINHPFLMIYSDLFIDAAYVNNPDPYYMGLNSCQNTILWGVGAGFTVLTYYDKLMRLEFTMNNRHLKGFYMHFEAPF
jgi:outer membrane protein assembly factor BamA